MVSPITPMTCKNTGRVLTEWYECEELTDEDIRARALEEMGIDPENIPWAKQEVRPITDLEPEVLDQFREYTNKVVSFKRRKFRHGMSNQEVAHRLNEATKIVDPSNYKFLPDDVRARTGLELNPLWAMEVLVRSGALAAKEQIAALTTLASYTHSKAPSLQHNTNINLKPEDWLLEIAKDEYQTIDVVRPESLQPMQRREAGEGKDYEQRRLAKDAKRQALIEKQSAEMEALMADMGDFEIEEGLQEIDE